MISPVKHAQSAALGNEFSYDLILLTVKQTGHPWIV